MNVVHRLRELERKYVAMTSSERNQMLSRIRDDVDENMMIEDQGTVLQGSTMHLCLALRLPQTTELLLSQLKTDVELRKRGKFGCVPPIDLLNKLKASKLSKSSPSSSRQKKLPLRTVKARQAFQKRIDEVASKFVLDDVEILRRCNLWMNFTPLHIAILSNASLSSIRLIVARCSLKDLCAPVIADDALFCNTNASKILDIVTKFTSLSSSSSCTAYGAISGAMSTGSTPLHLAIRSERIDVVRLLLNAGVMCENRNKKMDSSVEEKKDENEKNLEQPPLSLAAQLGFTEILKELIRFAPLQDCSALIIAAESGHMDCVRVLGERHDVSALDQSGVLQIMIRKSLPESVRLLMDLGIDPNKLEIDHFGQRRPILFEAIDRALVIGGEGELNVLKELLAPRRIEDKEAQHFPLMLSHLHVGVRRAARTGGEKGLRIMKSLSRYLHYKLFHEMNVLIPRLMGTLYDKSNHVNKLSSIQGVAKTVFGILCERTDDDSSREEVCDLDILPRRQCRWSEWPANVSTLRKDYEAEAKRKSGINLNYFHSDSAQTPLQVLCAVGDEKAVEWLLRAGAIADIDSENLRIKLSAAQYCARLYAQSNLDDIDDRDKEKRLQRREVSTCLRRYSLLLRTLVARQSKTALALVKATRYSQSDAEPVSVLCPTVASLRHELYAVSKYALKMCSFFVGSEAMSLEVREQYSYPPMRLYRRFLRQAQQDLGHWDDKMHSIHVIPKCMFRSFVELFAILLESLERLNRRIEIASDGGYSSPSVSSSSPVSSSTILSPTEAKRRKLHRRHMSNHRRTISRISDKELRSISGNVLAEALMLCARHGNKDVVEQLLEMLHSIRSQSFAVTDVVDFKEHHKQITPLMCAAMHGHVSMVELLLKHSANTELRDHANGWTALHHAARQLQPQVVKILMENGAAITAVDRFGRLPLHLVYRPNNGFSDRSIVVAESGTGVLHDETLAQMGGVSLFNYPTRPRDVAAAAASVAISASTSAIVAVASMSNKPLQTTMNFLRMWVRSKLVKQSMIRFRKKRTADALLPEDPDMAQNMLSTTDVMSLPPIPALHFFSRYNPGFRRWNHIAQFTLLADVSRRDQFGSSFMGEASKGAVRNRKRIKMRKSMFASIHESSKISELEAGSIENEHDSSNFKLPQTPIVEFMTEVTREEVKKSATSPTGSNTEEHDNTNLTHLALMSKTQQHRHWKTKERRASFVRKMSRRNIKHPHKKPEIENLSVETSPSSTNDTFSVTAPMTSTFHHAIQSSRHIAADALMQMTTTGFAKEDVMYRSSPERKRKHRRSTKGRRRAMKWFRSPTKKQGNNINSFSSEASMLNNITSKLFGDSHKDRHSKESNVSVHHETPVHLLPEEQLFADPSTQWVVEEYWKRLTLQTRLWLLLKKLIFLFLACFYAIITVGPTSALTTGSYVETGVATRLVDEELQGFPNKFFFDVDDLQELYLYIEGPMLDALFNSENTIGESSDLFEVSNNTKHIATFNRMVGSVRVRVVREGKSRSCGNADGNTPIGSGFNDEYSGMSGVCFGDAGTNQVYINGDVLSGVEPKMTYQDGKDNAYLLGWFGSVDSSGFVIDLPNHNATLAQETFRKLIESSFVDVTTRALIVSFTSYNAFKNIAVHGNLLFEFGLGGVVLPSAFFQSYTVPLRSFDWQETLFLALLIAPLTLDWVVEILNKEFRFSFLNPQRYMLIAAIFAFCAHFDVLDGVGEIEWGNSEIYASKSAEVALMGALVLLGFVDFFGVLTYMSSHLAMTVLIVWRMMRLLVGIVSVFLMVVVAFGFACYIMFFGSAESFQTLPKAVFGGWLGALSGDLSLLQLRRWGPKHHSENRAVDFTEYTVSVFFLLIMILVLVNFIIALMNDEYAEVKQRAAMHWARMQASMLIDEVSVQDHILHGKLYLIRWFLTVLTSNDDDAEDYEGSVQTDYESSMRHRSSKNESFGSFRRTKSVQSPRNQESSLSLSSWCGIFVRSCCCCCRRSILQHLHRSQRNILSKFAHRKNISVVKLKQSKAFSQAHDQISLLNMDVYITCSLFIALILISNYVLKSSYTTFSIGGLLCLLFLTHIFRVFSPDLHFCLSFCSDDDDNKNHHQNNTVVSRSSTDMVSQVTRFDSDDEDDEDKDKMHGILSMSTTLFESKEDIDRKKKRKKPYTSPSFVKVDIDTMPTSSLTTTTRTTMDEEGGIGDGGDGEIPLPDAPFPLISPQSTLQKRSRNSTGEIELRKLPSN